MSLSHLATLESEAIHILRNGVGVVALPSLNLFGLASAGVAPSYGRCSTIDRVVVWRRERPLLSAIVSQIDDQDAGGFFGARGIRKISLVARIHPLKSSSTRSSRVPGFLFDG